MPLTKYACDTVLKATVGQTNHFGGTIYLGLSSAKPDQDGNNVVEPNIGGYARVLIGSHNQSYTQKFSLPSEGIITNSQYIYFERSTGSWGPTLTHFVIYNSPTVGTGQLIGYGELQDENGNPTYITVTEEKTVVVIPIGGIKISMISE